MDLVVGVDFHVVLVPTPAGPVPTPIPHPFMGFTGDPLGAAVAMATAPLISLITEGKVSAPPGPVLVNGRPKMTTADLSRNLMLLPHVPLAPGTFAKRPSGEGRHQLGSMTVLAGGASSVRMGEIVLTCSDPLPLPTSIVVVIPKGPPVLVGGPSGFNLQDAVGNFVTGRLVRTATGAVSALARFVGRLTPTRLRNIASKALCTLTGHPVDVATGRVITEAIDVALPGPIPLTFERNYSSAWASRRTDLGHGWSHSLDKAIWTERDGVVCRLNDGREIVFAADDSAEGGLPVGQEVFDSITGYALLNKGNLGWQLTTPEGLIETYQRLADEVDPGAARSGLARCNEIRTRDGEHAVRLEWRAGRLATATDSAGRVVQFEHDAQGRIARILLPDPHEADAFRAHAEFIYSPRGMLVEARDALGNATTYAYKGKLMVEERRRNGVRFFWGYDGTSSHARCVRTWGYGAEGGSPIFNQKLFYDPRNRKTWRMDSDGNRTEFAANEVGLVTVIRDAVGGVLKRVYENMRLVEETDGEGNKFRWVHDERGRLAGTRDANKARTVIKYHDRFPELVVHYRDERGAVWKHRYDRRGRRVETFGPKGTGARYEWAGGLLSAIATKGGPRTDFGYDRQKNQIEIRSRNGPVVRREFDRRGQLVRETTATGDDRQRRSPLVLERDLLGRVAVAREPDGNVRRTAYDPEGNILGVEDAHGVQRFTYKGFDWLASREEGGDAVTFDYHAEGELKEIRNEKRRPYRFALDKCRRVVEEVGFDGLTANRFKRDKAGRVVEMATVTRKGAVVAKTDISYDAAGQIVRRQYSDGTFESFSYDLGGALTKAENQHATVNWERDVFGRVVLEKQGEAWIKTHYHLGGDFSGLDSSLGAHMSVLRDGDGASAKAFIGPLGGREQMEIGFHRDGFGQEIERTLPGGVVARWEWDEAGRPKRRSATNNINDAWTQAYAWQAGDRMETLTDSRYGRADFKHDARGRLYAERVADRVQYRAPDTVGNVYRTPDRSDRFYLPGGMPRQAGKEEMSYDLLGNMIRRQNMETGAGYGYTWDGAGRLIEAAPLDGGAKIAYIYDALGRRISKAVGEAETRWLWSGEAPIHEISNVAAGGDDDRRADRRESIITWYYEPDGSAPLAKVDGERRYSVVGDHLGTPTAVYDEIGGLAWQMQLDSYGVPRISDGATVVQAKTDCSWRWPGQYVDVDTGLHYNRYRYYAPDLGIYIHRDPIGIEGGLALYAYVDDPLTLIDPLGLSPCPPLATRREAWIEAKDMSTIPRSQQPERSWTIHDPARVRGPGPRHPSIRHQGRVYEFQISERQGARYVYIVDHNHDPHHGGRGHLHQAKPKHAAERLMPGDKYEKQPLLIAYL